MCVSYGRSLRTALAAMFDLATLFQLFTYNKFAFHILKSTLFVVCTKRFQCVLISERLAYVYCMDSIGIRHRRSYDKVSEYCDS